MNEGLSPDRREIVNLVLIKTEDLPLLSPWTLGINFRGALLLGIVSPGETHFLQYFRARVKEKGMRGRGKPAQSRLSINHYSLHLQHVTLRSLST